MTVYIQEQEVKTAREKELEAEIVRLTNELAERDAQIEQFKTEVRRQALGILGSLGLTFDDLQAWRMKQEAKGSKV